MTEEYHRSMVFSIHRFIMRLRFYCLNLHLADFYCLWLPSSGLRTAGCELRRRQAPPPEAEVEIGEADVSGADANDAEEDDAKGIGQFVHGAGII